MLFLAEIFTWRVLAKKGILIGSLFTKKMTILGFDGHYSYPYGAAVATLPSYW